MIGNKILKFSIKIVLFKIASNPIVKSFDSSSMFIIKKHEFFFYSDNINLIFGIKLIIAVKFRKKRKELIKSI